jgi:hypothetical protein
MFFWRSRRGFGTNRVTSSICLSAIEMRDTAKEDAVGSIGVASLLEISLVLTNTLVWSHGRSAVWFGSDGIVLIQVEKPESGLAPVTLSMVGPGPRAPGPRASGAKRRAPNGFGRFGARSLAQIEKKGEYGFHLSQSRTSSPVKAPVAETAIRCPQY